MNEGYKPIEWGAAMLAQAGQKDCGDQYLIEPQPNGLFLAVIDGLGHGPKAALAAQTAVEALRPYTDDDLPSLMQRCHQALMGTRGAVVTLARLDLRASALAWLSVGNVSAMLIHSDRNAATARDHLLLRGGVVGYRMPPLRVFTERLYPGDTLVIVTDGIRSTFVEDIPVHLPPQVMANAILDRYNRRTDDATVVVARYNG
ncbi:MAG: SpoIIE family protein phosphatase [Chloroflexi bacterium]|nr:SpoIIE family protein phosphatase [Chloroflexota bacterium]